VSSEHTTVTVHPDRLWGPAQPSPLFIEYRLFPRGKLPGSEADHFHLMPKFRMRGAIPPLSEIYGLLVWDDALLSRRRLAVKSLLPPRRQVLTKCRY